jgi:hypothetical protein
MKVNNDNRKYVTKALNLEERPSASAKVTYV